MNNISVSVPAIGSWVYWAAIEQANGRINSGLCEWTPAMTEALSDEGITGFWINGDDIAVAHLKGQLCDRRQQIKENYHLNEELEELVAHLRGQLSELGAE